LGPRGIVTAGIASLFGLNLVRIGECGADLITPLVFMIVLGTVLLNATTARSMAKLLGVFLSKSEGILIVGAGKLSRLIAKYLDKNNRHVVLVDSNASNVRRANELGLDALKEDIFAEDLTDNLELSDVGYLLSLTGNSAINQFAIDKFKKQFGENGSFRLITPEEMNDPQNNPKEGLFSHTDDFVKLTQVIRKYPEINEIKLNSKEHYDSLIEICKKDEDIVPIFIKQKTGVLDILPAFSSDIEFEKGSQLVYLGKKIIA